MTQDDINNLYREQLESRDKIINILLENQREERKTQAKNIRWIATPSICVLGIVLAMFVYLSYTADYTTVQNGASVNTNSNNTVQGDMTNELEYEGGNR